jgi:hypothetical protein
MRTALPLGPQAFDADGLARVRDSHPAWRLLRYEHAPLAVALFHRVFIAPNVRTVDQAQLTEALEDELHAYRSSLGEQAPSRPAAEYLVEWTSNERGWLRRFYPEGDDQPAFDLTPAAEQAVLWVVRLVERPFVATESRLRVLVDLLGQMARGIQTDPDIRLRDLERQRAEIDAEIERVRGGHMAVTGPRELREQFQQFVVLARELLGDFRLVEHHFRVLDRQVREQIASWDGAKGTLVGEILDQRDAIDESDEGRSFRAFWELLMSQQRQDEMTDHLEQVLGHPAVTALAPDRRLRRIHHDWLKAGEHTQRRVALLSSQLRRFLDDAAWLEDRRIVEILRQVEGSALAVRDRPPPGSIHHIDLPAADIALPLERPLFAPRQPPVIDDTIDEADETAVDVGDLFAQQVVDVERIADHVERLLDERGQVTLRELCTAMPIERGLAELVTYLHLGAGRFSTTTDERVEDLITWTSGDVERTARLARVVFVR